jgi:hypothetical protein
MSEMLERTIEKELAISRERHEIVKRPYHVVKKRIVITQKHFDGVHHALNLCADDLDSNHAEKYTNAFRLSALIQNFYLALENNGRNHQPFKLSKCIRDTLVKRMIINTSQKANAGVAGIHAIVGIGFSVFSGTPLFAVAGLGAALYRTFKGAPKKYVMEINKLYNEVYTHEHITGLLLYAPSRFLEYTSLTQKQSPNT